MDDDIDATPVPFFARENSRDDPLSSEAKSSSSSPTAKRPTRAFLTRLALPGGGGTTMRSPVQVCFRDIRGGAMKRRRGGGGRDKSAKQSFKLNAGFTAVVGGGG